MTAIKSFEKPLTPEEEVYYLNLLKNENNKEAADYSVENGSQVEASIIEKSIKNSNINFSNAGDSKQDYLEYFKVLENENAKSIGEKIPNEDFFYEG